jgi:hypothetical protein
MHTLISAAVFGLVPIPPADSLTSRRCDLRPTNDHCDFSKHLFVRRPIAKRMATKEELARIREDVEALGADNTRIGDWCR